MAGALRAKKNRPDHTKKSLSKPKNKEKLKISVPSAKLLVGDLGKRPKTEPVKNKMKWHIIPKSNEELRGAALCLLIKGLPLNVKIHKLKKDLVNTPKSIGLSKKDGQRSALVTFKSEADCAESFDALKGYSFEGHETFVSFVRPRSIVDKKNVPMPSCFDFLLDVGNIPFYFTLEDLKKTFSKAESIIQRCRHDNSFKGSCILAFTSQEDYNEAMSICEQNTVEGRKLTWNPASVEDCKALLEELISSSATSKGNREGLQIKVFNLPYTVTRDELKKTFPQARHIFLPTTKEGEPTGIGILTFKTKVICRSALEKAKKMQLGGRQLRVELNVSKVNDTKDKAPNGKARGKFNRKQSMKRHHTKLKSKQPSENPKLNLD
ncbi:hypothetical protein Aperf_G00000005044 [Anoplocephala perfoliata]